MDNSATETDNTGRKKSQGKVKGDEFSLYEKPDMGIYPVDR